MPIEVKTLPFPKGGLVLDSPYSQQPEGTTFKMKNVRVESHESGRLRGGQRAGTTKYISDTVNGSNSVQALDSIVLAFDSSLVVADTVISADPNDVTKTESFTYSDGALETVSSTRWTSFHATTINNWAFAFGSATNDSTSLKVLSSACTATNDAADDYRCATLTSKPALGSAFILQADVTLPKHSSDLSEFRFQWRMKDDPTNPGDVNRNEGYSVVMMRASGTGAVAITVKLTELTAGSGQTDSVGPITITTTSDETYSATLKVIVNGTKVTIDVDGVAWITDYTMGSFSTQDNTGIAVVRNLATPTIDNVIYYVGTTPASLRTVKIIAVSGGSIYDGTKDDGLNVLGSGSSALSSSNAIATVPLFQNMFFSDGFVYKAANMSTRVVSLWQDSVTAGSLPVGGRSTTYDIDAVDAGAKTFEVSEDLSSLSDGDFIEVKNSTGNNGSYTVASTSGSGPTTITVDQTPQSGVADGTIAVGDVTCTMMVIYRKRVALAGLETQPSALFLAKAGDAFNWDYFPAIINATMAIAINFEDVITALIPFQDDVLYVGCDHTFWAVQGDPADGGVIDNVSHQVGIVGQYAWTWSPINLLYFMAQNGFYKMSPGGVPEPIEGKLDSIFRTLDYATNRVHLYYDLKRRGVHILIVPVVAPQAPTAHYWWDERQQHFVEDELPIVFGPISGTTFDADKPDDRAVLFGGRDGYIRHFDNAILNDDTGASTTPIDSQVVIPILPQNNLVKMRLNRVTPIISADSDVVTIKIFGGNNPEDVAANVTSNTFMVSKDLVAGRNSMMRQRVSAGALAISLSNNTASETWAFESIEVSLFLHADKYRGG